MHGLTVAHNMASPNHNSMLTVACSQCHSGGHISWPNFKIWTRSNNIARIYEHRQ